MMNPYLIDNLFHWSQLYGICILVRLLCQFFLESFSAPKHLFNTGTTVTIFIFIFMLFYGEVGCFYIHIDFWQPIQGVFFNDLICLDRYTIFFSGLVSAFSITFLFYSKRIWVICLSLRETRLFLAALFFFLIALPLCCDFISFYLFLEGSTLATLLLLFLSYSRSTSLEAGVKYFCLSTASASLLLIGIAMLFGYTGKTNFNMITYHLAFYDHSSALDHIMLFSSFFCLLFGFFFKLSIFPCHFWSPDVYEGVSFELVLIFSTIIKTAVFSLFIKIFLTIFSLSFFYYKSLLIIFCICSILIGCFGSLAQTKLKRFIAYSSMNQLSLFLLGMVACDFEGIVASLGGFIIYNLTLYIFIAIIMNIRLLNNSELVYLNDLKGLKHYNYKVAYLLSLLLVSMAGIPPLAGFFAKYFILLNLFNKGFYLVAFFILVVNLISSFYYLRIIKCLFFEQNLANSSLLETNQLSFWQHFNKAYWKTTSTKIATTFKQVKKVVISVNSWETLKCNFAYTNLTFLEAFGFILTFFLTIYVEGFYMYVELLAKDLLISQGCLPLISF